MKSTILIILLFFITGCEYIVEPFDLREESVQLSSPKDKVVLNSETVFFVWEKNPNIDFYRLQVVSPNFENSSSILIDTLLSVNFHQDTLINNRNYEWQVRGENSLYFTENSKNAFSLISESNISNKTLVLLSPKNGLTVNEENVNFTWDNLVSAQNYRIQIAYPSFENALQIVIDSLISQSNFKTSALPQNKNYEWRVRGENDEFRTSFSTSSFAYSIAHDITKSFPIIVAPKDSVIFQEINTRLSWEKIEGANFYRVNIAFPDFEKTTQIFLDTVVDQLHLMQALPLNKKLQWRVRAENEFYQSNYITKNLRVIDDSDISNLKVELLAPFNNAKFSNRTFNFSWLETHGISSYQIQVATPNFNRPIEIVLDTIVNDLNLRVTLEESLKYQWRVRGVNNYSATTYASAWNFEID